MTHPSGCMCIPCKAERNARTTAIERIKAEGRWIEPRDTIKCGEGVEDRIGAQEAIILNLAAIDAELHRVH